MLAIVDTDLNQFNGVNLATAVNRMAKMRSPPDVVAEAVQRPALAHLKAAIGAPVASACLCSGVAEPCAHLRMGVAPMPRAHKPGTAARRAGELTARHVAVIVHAFAVLRHHPGHALLAASAAQAAERVAEANAQVLENTAWGFAKLQFNPGDALLRACEAAAVRHAEGFTPQAVVRVNSQCTCVHPQMGHSMRKARAKVLWRLAHCATCDPVALAAHPSVLFSHSDRCGGSACTLGMHAHTTLRHAGTHNWSHQSPKTPVTKRRLCAQAKFMWAYGALGKPMGSACMEALAAHAQKLLPRFRALQLADMMWAFAKFGRSPSAPMLRDCEACATRIARAMHPRDVVRCCLLHWG